MLSNQETDFESNSSTSPIAVIGMGCHYPGANKLQRLWENILARRVQFREFPHERLPLSEYYDPDKKTPDKTYGSRAGVIDGFEFDWGNRRIPKKTVDSTDIVHWLALETANQALEDAGYSRETVKTENTGVILGNTLTGEQFRSNTLRLRWPYVRKALRAAGRAKGMSTSAVENLVEIMEKFYKSTFAPVTEDTLAGNLANTIAGRICNFFNFDGGGYTVDGACSSSLIAVANAANALDRGELDLALAGGVDISLDTFEIIGFAKTGALTAEDMTVYDRKASGFIPGEGCGFVVLKRLADAEADGDYVYGILRGWGISSDGKGGITAPSKVGQAKALLRAYKKAGYSPHKLDFIEGHGTGTPVGDRTELEGIALAINADGETTPRAVGVTSFKSLVGHTKAAAGIGGFIKAIMAVNQRVIPPTANCQNPNPVFDASVQCAYPIMTGEVRDPEDSLCAGVSAMGFGGINSHVTITSGDKPASHLKPSVEERALLVCNQDTELFVLSASSLENLIQSAQALINRAEGISVAEVVDLAATVCQEVDVSQPIRAGLIAGTPEALKSGLIKLIQTLNDRPPAREEIRVSPQKDIWISNHVKRNRVAFVFPGQGSQKLNMARTLVERYSWARELVEQADSWLQELGFEKISDFIYRPLERAANPEEVQSWLKQLSRAEVASASICLASLLWKHYLERLGITPVATGGHSLGELTAFHQAGAFDEKTLLCFASLRGRAMSSSQNQPGLMASLSCSQEMAQNILQNVQGYAIIANINSPMQTVISGENSSIEQAIKIATSKNIQARQLPVANAFHSQMVSPARDYLRQQALIPEELTETEVSLFSSVNGRQIKSNLNLREHFAHQVVNQVDFISLIQGISQQCDIILEVGPGRVLSGLVDAIDRSKNCLCFSVESKPNQQTSLNTFLAGYFVSGGEINWEILYENRLVRPFVQASQRKFIDNQCERPFQVSSEEISSLLSMSTNEIDTSSPLNAKTQTSPLDTSFAQTVDEEFEEKLSNYFSQRASFLADLILADLETSLFNME